MGICQISYKLLNRVYSSSVNFRMMLTKTAADHYTYCTNICIKIITDTCLYKNNTLICQISHKLIEPGILVFCKLQNDAHEDCCRSLHVLHKYLHKNNYRYMFVQK